MQATVSRPSAVWISHIGGGIDYIYGDKVSGFAIGPSLGLTSSGPLFGMLLYFRNVFARVGFVATRAFSSSTWGSQFALGYSFYFGR